MNLVPWKAGAATVAITPGESMWLAGWAARREPATGTAMELFAKAVALEDGAGERVVIVTADLIAIPATLAHAVAARVQTRCRLPRARLLFNASHTHTGPELRPDKVPFFEIPPPFAAKIAPYLIELEQKLAAVIEAALNRLEPVTLHAHQARAGFAHNRRTPAGPTDHAVPVLALHRADDRPLAILFGYACHNLTLPPSCCDYHGDYAGVAQAVLTEKFPGVTALFLAGAGADQDPAPRGTLELAHAHGKTLANAVADAIAGRSKFICAPHAPGEPAADNSAPTAGHAGTRVAAGLRVGFEEVELDLQPPQAREALELDARSDDAPRRRKAAFLLTALAEDRALPGTLRCPVQALRFGDEVLLLALGGEPVIDFALQLKSEFRCPLVWVAGYSNDMFGYLPTRRIQQEGGYEGGRAALWSALPMPVAESSGERVLDAARRLAAVSLDK